VFPISVLPQGSEWVLQVPNLQETAYNRSIIHHLARKLTPNISSGFVIFPDCVSYSGASSGIGVNSLGSYPGDFTSPLEFVSILTADRRDVTNRTRFSSFSSLYNCHVLVIFFTYIFSLKCIYLT